MYKLIKNIQGKVFGACTEQNNLLLSFSFAPANTDYQTFKKEINEGTAQLEDAEGVLMTPQQAKDFVATLP